MVKKLEVQVIIGSVRHARGRAIGEWIHALANRQPEFHSTLIDLSEVGLEFAMEAQSPSTGVYEWESTKAWSATVQKADAYMFVFPEYNHGYPAVLKNAVDRLYAEWNNKPVAFVSYSGGASGGIRAVEQMRQVVVELQMAPIREEVNIPHVGSAFDEHKQFNSAPFMEKANRMLAQLARWAATLKNGRV